MADERYIIQKGYKTDMNGNPILDENKNKIEVWYGFYPSNPIFRDEFATAEEAQRKAQELNASI